MIFKSIELNNFRQYKGMNKYCFSIEKDQPITLLIADNRVGKTTFVQAFRFCFYGNLANNKYLKLPKPNELLPFSLIHNESISTREEVVVKVEFEHNGNTYIMNRKYVYAIASGVALKIEEHSSLSYSTEYEGFKTIINEEADIEMNNLLPAGLSHVFMFDGERMERQIDSKDFQDELKESILGILNLKKYDALIEQLGSISRKTSVIGRINAKITVDDLVIRKANADYNKLNAKTEQLEVEISDLKNERDNLNKRYEKLRSEQRQLQINKENIERLKSIEFEEEVNDRNILELERHIVSNGLKALKLKSLLDIKEIFDTRVSDGLSNGDIFYQYLHVNTLEKILEVGKCICGTPVLRDTIEEHIIHDLKRLALPKSNAQNVSFIQSDLFNKVYDYSDHIIKMKSNKQVLDSMKSERQQLDAQIKKLNEVIGNNETLYGKNDQTIIEEIQNRKDEINQIIGMRENDLNNHRRVTSKHKNELKKILGSDTNNKKITEVTDRLEAIKEGLIHEKHEKETLARNVLSRYFNEEISIVMSGNYRTQINEKYEISIWDVDMDINVTDVLSTGQNVITSLSFIKSLINTAKELSIDYKTSSDYGVIMDAALSNLDETHIKKVSENNLGMMDQLIFLSFKRQLRGEMYESISNKVGHAYSIVVEDEYRKHTKLSNDEILDYINYKGEETNDQ